MPLQPYSQPSGPQTSWLKTLCLALRSQPSSTTCGGPAGSSPFGLSGTKSRFGVEQSQTPPKPTAMPDRFVAWSEKTLRESKWPVPFLSSKMRMRSSPSVPSVFQWG